MKLPKYVYLWVLDNLHKDDPDFDTRCSTAIPEPREDTIKRQRREIQGLAIGKPMNKYKFGGEAISELVGYYKKIELPHYIREESSDKSVKPEDWLTQRLERQDMFISLPRLPEKYKIPKRKKHTNPKDQPFKQGQVVEIILSDSIMSAKNKGRTVIVTKIYPEPLVKSGWLMDGISTSLLIGWNKAKTYNLIGYDVKYFSKVNDKK